MNQIAKRCCLVAALLLLVAGAQQVFARRMKVVEHRRLAELPREIGDWQEVADLQIDDGSAAVLKADDYVLRRMRNSRGEVVELFIAYYENQRAGESMHSPKNCMPGSGWTPIATDLVELGDGARVNRYVVEKTSDRALMLYWYQERGKVIASEYAGKFELIASTITSGRRDGAIIRVLRTSKSRASQAEETAVVKQFADSLRPVLPAFIPE